MLRNKKIALFSWDKFKNNNTFNWWIVASLASKKKYTHYCSLKKNQTYGCKRNKMFKIITPFMEGNNKQYNK